MDITASTIRAALPQLPGPPPQLATLSAYSAGESSILRIWGTKRSGIRVECATACRMKITRNRLVCWASRTALVLASVTMFAACAPLPSATPEAIGLAGNSIELNAVAAQTALNSLIDNAKISREQIAVAREELSQIAGTLSPQDLDRLQKAVQFLDRASNSIQPSEQVLSVRDQIRPRLESTSSALKQIQSILAEHVEQDQIVENLVKRLREAVSDENQKR